MDIVTTFQDITQQALTANYGVRKIFEDPGLRLATLVVTRNTDFADDLTARGHEYAFERDENKDDANNDVNSETDCEQDSVDDARSLTTEEDSFSSRKVAECEDLHEILHEGAPVEPSTQDGITAWIGQLYNDARGFEIGTFNHTLLSTLMRKQSAKWPNLAQGYVSDIISHVHKFIQAALLAASADSEISSRIISLLMDDLVESYRKAISVADFLLEIERAGTPMTLNHYLNDNLQKW